jgi:hypothetical protein
MAAAPAAPAAAAAAAAPTLDVGGRSVRLLNDAHFGALRTALGYDAWLPAALSAFDWGKMAAGGGKGGDKMARTPCKRLFVKEVSAGDNATLSHQGFLKARALCAARRARREIPQQHIRCRACVLRAHATASVRLCVLKRACARGSAQAYVARVSTGKSLIVHIVAHFARPDGQTCMVMNNWLPVRLAPPLSLAFAVARGVRGASAHSRCARGGVWAAAARRGRGGRAGAGALRALRARALWARRRGARGAARSARTRRRSLRAPPRRHTHIPPRAQPNHPHSSARACARATSPARAAAAAMHAARTTAVPSRLP